MYVQECRPFQSGRASPRNLAPSAEKDYQSIPATKTFKFVIQDKTNKYIVYLMAPVLLSVLLLSNSITPPPSALTRRESHYTPQLDVRFIYRLH